MDYLAEPTMYEAYVRHQTSLLAEFEAMAQEYGFAVVDASGAIRRAFREIQRHVWPVIEEIVPKGDVSVDVFAEPPIMPPEERHEERQALSERVREVLTALLEESE
jgi:hypothetical protein